MSTITYTTIELLTPQGPEFRQVSTAAPRPPTADEMPLIDLSAIDGDLESRKAVALKIKAAAENTGFFYIHNHGIPEQLIHGTLEQMKQFFSQPLSEKEKASFQVAGHSSGYHGLKSGQINKTESRDNKETFSMRYDASMDPARGGILDSTGMPAMPDESIWDGTRHLEGFRSVLIEFYQRRLALARKLIRLFAMALDLPENFFDAITTHPGADAVHIHYPGAQETPESSSRDGQDIDVGIGSHTDIQCLTLLWQDLSGGLQVLSLAGDWLDAKPIEGTLVVNIGDFLQRLSNNRFRSTVHRVYNRKKTSRYAMPFFLGFNPEAVCEVVPTCVDEDHPALYEPISCGKDLDNTSGPSSLAFASSPVVVLREIGSRCTGSRRQALDTANLDLVAGGILDQNTEKELIDLFCTTHKHSRLLYDRQDLAAIREMWESSSFLRAVCCLKGMVCRANFRNTSIHRTVYDRVRNSMGQALLLSPLTLAETYAVLLMTDGILDPAQDGSEFIDSWLLTGFCAQQAVLAINLPKIVSSIAQDETSIEDQRAIRLCFYDASLQDSMMLAEIQLYSTLLQILRQSSFNGSAIEAEEFTSWRERWSHLLCDAHGDSDSQTDAIEFDDTLRSALRKTCSKLAEGIIDLFLEMKPSLKISLGSETHLSVVYSSLILAHFDETESGLSDQHCLDLVVRIYDWYSSTPQLARMINSGKLANRRLRSRLERATSDTGNHSFWDSWSSRPALQPSEILDNNAPPASNQSKPLTDVMSNDDMPSMHDFFGGAFLDFYSWDVESSSA
ncbi:2OG-Fe(II)oxygenase superfamily protein [Seiridium cupressi]